MHNNNLLNTLVTSDLTYVKKWIDESWSKKDTLKDFNWHGLAEGLAHNFTISKEVEWAEIAIKIYEFLASDIGQPYRESFTNSLMNLRVKLITQTGIISEDYFYDLSIIIKWFYKDLNISYKDAKKMINNKNKQPVENLRQLRNIKNKLSILDYLNTEGYLKEYPDLLQWFTIHEDLP